MKKAILAALIIMGMGLGSSAQILRGGFNFANISITNDGDVDEANMLPTFQVGLLGDFRILPMLYVQPGILFTGKGSKTEYGQESDATYSRATTNPYYLEIPVNLVLKSPTGPVKFFAGAGPYLGIGIAGKLENEGKILGVSYRNERDIEFSDDDPRTLDYEEGAGYGIMKRFDYGANILAGVEFSKLVLGVNYGHGFAKLQSGTASSADDKNKHRVLSFTVGIRLN